MVGPEPQFVALGFLTVFALLACGVLSGGACWVVAGSAIAASGAIAIGGALASHNADSAQRLYARSESVIRNEESKGEKAKPDREQRPDDAPSETKDIDKDKRLDRGRIHDIKRGLGAKDWVGISPDGRVWINEGGSAVEWGHIDDWDRSDKPGKR